MKPSNGTICKECPYRTNCAPGYFGDNNIETYLLPINHDILTPCHKTQGKSNVSFCSGLAAVRTNTHKMANDPIIRASEAAMRPSTEQRKEVFADRSEFLVHHSKMIIQS